MFLKLDIPTPLLASILLPVKPLSASSISRSDKALSPGSGGVVRSALLSSATSTCPLSSSSNAEKAFRSSCCGEIETNADASELRYCGSDIC